MKNYVNEGKKITITASGTSYSAGQLVIVGALACVCAVDIADGESGVAHIVGAFDLPAATAAIGQGVNVYWDADGDPVDGTAGSGACTATATDNTLIGKTLAAKASGGALARVKLNA